MLPTVLMFSLSEDFLDIFRAQGDFKSPSDEADSCLEFIASVRPREHTGELGSVSGATSMFKTWGVVASDGTGVRSPHPGERGEECCSERDGGESADMWCSLWLACESAFVGVTAAGSTATPVVLVAEAQAAWLVVVSASVTVVEGWICSSA